MPVEDGEVAARSRSQPMADDVTQSLDLVLRAQEGDKDALNRLCERYYERVRRIVRLRLGSKLRESVDSGDILQDTFFQAVRSFENFEMREESSLINWLARLAERQIIAAADYQSAKKRERDRNVAWTSTNVGRESHGFPIANADRSSGVLERIGSSEEQALLEQAMDRLPSDYRELVIQRHYEGASWEAIAESTGRPSAAAARMMHARALIELGKFLRESGIE
jgi:RNA polymerase sigma-70 factor (ECF subfamily)